jgi:hypothetical protein
MSSLSRNYLHVHAEWKFSRAQKYFSPCEKCAKVLFLLLLLLLLLGVRGKPRMYRSLLAYCTPRFSCKRSNLSLLDAPAPTDAFRTPAAEIGTTTMSGNRPINSAEIATSTVHLGIFYMPQICNMGPTALLPFRRKACLRIFLLLKIRRLRPGLNPRTWVPEARPPKPLKVLLAWCTVFRFKKCKANIRGIWNEMVIR